MGRGHALRHVQLLPVGLRASGAGRHVSRCNRAAAHTAYRVLSSWPLHDAPPIHSSTLPNVAYTCMHHVQWYDAVECSVLQYTFYAIVPCVHAQSITCIDNVHIHTHACIINDTLIPKLVLTLLTPHPTLHISHVSSCVRSSHTPRPSVKAWQAVEWHVVRSCYVVPLQRIPSYASTSKRLDCWA